MEVIQTLTYKAFDGTIFKQQADCEAYEKEHIEQPLKEGIDAYDYKFELIPYEDSYAFFTKIKLVRIKNPIAVKVFRSRCRYYGISSTGIRECGNYYYNNNPLFMSPMGWTKVEDLVVEMQKTISRLNNMFWSDDLNV